MMGDFVAFSIAGARLEDGGALYWPGLARQAREFPHLGTIGRIHCDKCTRVYEFAMPARSSATAGASNGSSRASSCDRFVRGTA